MAERKPRGSVAALMELQRKKAGAALMMPLMKKRKPQNQVKEQTTCFITSNIEILPLYYKYSKVNIMNAAASWTTTIHWTLLRRSVDTWNMAAFILRF